MHRRLSLSNFDNYQNNNLIVESFKFFQLSCFRMVIVCLYLQLWTFIIPLYNLYDIYKTYKIQFHFFCNENY